MRVGTWNLEGKWSDAHLALLTAMDCDVLLLTEVSTELDMPGHTVHLGQERMAPNRFWAGIVVQGNDLVPLDDPHPASALASFNGWTFCSSILPWSGSGGEPPWVGGDHAARTSAAVGMLLRTVPRTRLVWGGDWNHSMSGREYAGSNAGRATIIEALDELLLQVPTADLAHRTAGILTIDHVAVPATSLVIGASRIVAAGPPQLSDHDAYVVEFADP